MKKRRRGREMEAREARGMKTILSYVVVEGKIEKKYCDNVQNLWRISCGFSVRGKNNDRNTKCEE